MQFGVCSDIDKAGLLSSVGFDYVELPLNRIATLHEDEYQEYRRDVLSAPLPARAFNCFFPKGLQLTGPDVDRSVITNYVENALKRMDELGGETLVFGSGGARRVPEGFPQAQARDQLLDLLRAIGDVASDHDIQIVLEPLRTAESNIVNTVAEGLGMVEELDHPSVCLLVDYYHMVQEGESCEVIAEAGDAVHHVHIAEPQTRQWPAPEDSRAYEEFIEALVSVGYNRTISVEGRSRDVNRDAPHALACLKGLWETG